MTVSSISLWLLLPFIHAQYVDFYIKQWIVINTHNVTGGGQVGGYDAKSELLYVLGGNLNQQMTTSEYIYNPKTDQYQYKNSIIATSTYQGQQYTSITAKNTSSYIFFENTNYDYPNTNFFVFDMQTNVVSKTGTSFPKPTQTIYECFTSDTQFIHLIGGMDYSGNSLNYYYKFDITKNEYITGPKMIVARVTPGCIVVEHNLYVFGGDFPVNTVNNGSNTIEMIDLTDNSATWKMVDTIIQDQYLSFPVAFYPSISGVKSNTIFIISVREYPATFSCYKFNFINNGLSKCGSSPKVTMNAFLGISVAINDEFRFYMFGNVSPAAPVPFQYALLSYNQSATKTLM